MTLKIQYYTQFKRDIKRAKKRRLDMALLKEVINTLQARKPLDAKISRSCIEWGIHGVSRMPYSLKLALDLQDH